jgi:hypothetical protein
VGLVWTVKIGAEEGREIRLCLGDDEIVYVEEFCNAVERGVARVLVV